MVKRGKRFWVFSGRYLRYAQRLQGKSKKDPEDAMLAGIAIQNNKPLLTRNKKDSAGIPQPKLETY
jgi:predicted nucleic acid-binding protein